VLVERRLREGLRDGSIDVAFRRWRRAQVVAGRVYRIGGGERVRVVAAEVVDPATVSDTDARRAGFPDAAAALADLPERDGDVHRIELRLEHAPDPRDELAARGRLDDAEVAELRDALARLDARSARGPWTRATLEAIAAEPGRLAADLAGRAGVERDVFKRDVRKLKALGLTESLQVGYRLSPRGRALLGALPPPER
jgi:hypothetical protein